MDQHTFHWAPPETHQADFQHHFRWGHYRNPQTELLAATSLPFFFFFSDSSKNQYCNLVGGLNHLEKYEFVNGKDDIPYSIMENKSHVWNHHQQQYIGDYTTIQQYCNISILSAYYQHIISIYPIIARIPWPAVGSIQRKPRHFLGCWSLASTWFGWL